MWLKLFISVETLFSSKKAANMNRLPFWYLNPKRALHSRKPLIWTLNVYTWSHLRCRYVWTPDEKMFFFPVKRTGGYQHVSLSLSFGDLIQMDSSDMLNLCAYIETACYYQPGAHVTKTKIETCILWPALHANENLAWNSVWPRPRCDGCLPRSGYFLPRCYNK